MRCPLRHKVSTSLLDSRRARIYFLATLSAELIVLLRPFPFDFGQKPRTHFHRKVAEVAGSFAQSLSVRREVCPAWASQEALSASRLDCSPSRSTQRRKARARTVRNPTALPDRRSSFLASPGSRALRLLVGPGCAFRVRTVCASPLLRVVGLCVPCAPAVCCKSASTVQPKATRRFQAPNGQSDVVGLEGNTAHAWRCAGARQLALFQLLAREGGGQGGVVGSEWAATPERRVR